MPAKGAPKISENDFCKIDMQDPFAALTTFQANNRFFAHGNFCQQIFAKPLFR